MSCSLWVHLPVLLLHRHQCFYPKGWYMNNQINLLILLQICQCWIILTKALDVLTHWKKGKMNGKFVLNRAAPGFLCWRYQACSGFCERRIKRLAHCTPPFIAFRNSPLRVNVLKNPVLCGFSGHSCALPHFPQNLKFFEEALSLARCSLRAVHLWRVKCTD